MTHACDGRCCAVFPLPKDAQQRLQQGANGNDSQTILDMLIPLTRRQATRRFQRLYNTKLPWKQTSRTSDLYTCKHWDDTTHLCTIYDHRPRMCRNYPYGRHCDHPTCTRKGHHPPE